VPLTRRDFIKYVLVSLLTYAISSSDEPKHKLRASMYDGNDFLIVYIPGGIGANSLAQDPDMASIINGIKLELESFGYSVKVTEYRRASDSNILFAISEFLTSFEYGAWELASQLEKIMMNHNQKVILVGECLGAVFINKVMKMMKDNDDLYSIQLGPVWYASPVSYRTLVIRGTGEFRDPIANPTLHDIPRILRISLRRPDIGHDYNWRSKYVRGMIKNFLHENFAQ